jgi:hypothetical protein
MERGNEGHTHTHARAHTHTPAHMYIITINFISNKLAIITAHPCAA